MYCLHVGSPLGLLQVSVGVSAVHLVAVSCVPGGVCFVFAYCSR